MADHPGEPVDLLLVDDSEGDAKLMVRELRKHGFEPRLERVESVGALRDALARQKWQIVVSDSGVPRLPAVEALAVTREADPSVPFIVVSGTITEDLAVQAIRRGASDWVTKDNLDRLASVVRRELEAAAGKAERLAALTPRQREVLRLIGLGETSREIAARLRVSVKTVESHRAQLMERLGVRNLAGLVRCAVRMGLVSAET